MFQVFFTIGYLFITFISTEILHWFPKNGPGNLSTAVNIFLNTKFWCGCVRSRKLRA